jgi:predicted glycoside hydrolase/deacetylase ChbG (UPF0249 family)
MICGISPGLEPTVVAQALDEGLKPATERPRLIVRVDDTGFCHAANMALKRILQEGICTSASVIVAAPWLDEAVEILRAHPEVSVGVHLTLNCEWKEYRWGPVLPRGEVPSLVDQYGKLFGTRAELMANKPKTEEVAKELRAQIELALRKGLPISYLDYHMGAAMATREFQEVVENLAREYQLGISQYFGETYAPSVYREPPEGKLAKSLEIIRGMNEPKLYHFVVHPGMNTPEMAAMTDLNATGVKPMAAHRQAETDMLCDPSFRRAIEESGIGLVGYAELKAAGLDRMKRPWLADPYGVVQSQPSKPEPPSSH